MKILYSHVRVQSTFWDAERQERLPFSRFQKIPLRGKFLMDLYRHRM